MHLLHLAQVRSDFYPPLTKFTCFVCLDIRPQTRLNPGSKKITGCCTRTGQAPGPHAVGVAFALKPDASSEGSEDFDDVREQAAEYPELREQAAAMCGAKVLAG